MTELASRPGARAHLIALLVIVAALAALAAVAGLDGPPAATAAPPRQYLPYLASRGFTTGVASDWVGDAPNGLAAVGDAISRHGAASPCGVVGWGESTIELQSQSARPSRATIDLTSFMFDPLSFGLDLPELGARTVPLKRVAGVTASIYSAVVSREEPLAAVARTTWEGGGAAAYLAAEADRELVLPLAMRNVFTHSSLIQIMNADPAREAEIVMRSYMGSGAVRSEWELTLSPGETGRIDPSFEAEFSGLSMESLWFSSNVPLAVMAIGDEFDGRGVSSLRARPVASGDRQQWLPFVRANAGGDSLLAVANVSERPNDVTITYRGAAASPSGAGQVIEQKLRIGPRSARFVDFDVERRRGNEPPPPGFPRGRGPGRGFFGSATITGSEPLLAAAFEQAMIGSITNVVASAAYNAFGPQDLSPTFAIPHVRFAEEGYTTQIALLNPGQGPVSVAIDLVADAGGTHQVPVGSLGAGEMTVVSAVLPAPGSARASIEASAPIAVLVFDVGTGLDHTAYWAVKMPRELIHLPPRRPTNTPGPVTATPTLRPPTATTMPPSPTAQPGSPTAGPSATETAETATPPPSPGEVTIHLPRACKHCW